MSQVDKNGLDDMFLAEIVDGNLTAFGLLDIFRIKALLVDLILIE